MFLNACSNIWLRVPQNSLFLETADDTAVVRSHSVLCFPGYSRTRVRPSPAMHDPEAQIKFHTDSNCTDEDVTCGKRDPTAQLRGNEPHLQFTENTCHREREEWA